MKAPVIAHCGTSRNENRLSRFSLLLDRTSTPLGFEGGDTNLYRYVGNNPINRIDPSGNQEEEPLYTRVQLQERAREFQKSNPNISQVEIWNTQIETGPFLIGQKPKTWGDYYQETPEWKAEMRRQEREEQERIYRESQPKIGPQKETNRDRARNGALSENEQKRQDDLRSYVDWRESLGEQVITERQELEWLDGRVSVLEARLNQTDEYLSQPGLARFINPANGFSMNEALFFGGKGAPRGPAFRPRDPLPAMLWRSRESVERDATKARNYPYDNLPKVSQPTVTKVSPSFSNPSTTTSALDGLSKSGASAKLPNGLTRAGHAFEKHATGQRSASSKFPKLSGGIEEKNATGQRILDDILHDPSTTRSLVTGGNFKGGTRFTAPDGLVAVFDKDGVFQYFGE